MDIWSGVEGLVFGQRRIVKRPDRIVKLGRRIVQLGL